MKKLLTLFAVLAFVACSDDDGNKGGDNPNYDFERTAAYISAHFYGDLYSPETGTNNYYLTFAILEENSDNEVPTHLYWVDIYTDGDSPDKIPNGTYNLDLDGTTASGTLDAAASGYQESEPDVVAFTEGKLVVTDSKMVLTVTTEDGKTHKVIYSGDYEVIDDRNSDNNYLNHNYGNWATTLTDDIVIEHNADYVIADYWEDDYGMGYNVLMFNFVKSDNIGGSLWIEIAIENLDFAGTYSPCKTWNYARVGNLITANMYTDGDPYGGCWYWHSEDGEISDEYAPLVAGSLTITDNGDDTYTFAYEGYDAIENGNKVSLNWTGEIEIDDNTQEASAQQRIYPLRREVKMMPMAAHSHKKMAAKFRK